MGSWGIRALESDCGLDVIDFLDENYGGSKKIILSKLLANMIDDGLLAKDRGDIEYLFDNSIISIAELFIMFKEQGEIEYDNEDDEALSLRNIKIFKSDKKSLRFILKRLEDIKNEKPDVDNMREYHVLWRDSKSYDAWKMHLDTLINKIRVELG